MGNLENLENYNPEENILSFEDENGTELHFEICDFLAYEGNEYVVLYPLDDDNPDNDGSVVILGIRELDEENEEYYGIQDEELLMTLFNMFMERNKDAFESEE